MTSRTDELKTDLEMVRTAIREVVAGNRLAECTVRGRTYKYQIVGMPGLRELEMSIARKLNKSKRRRVSVPVYNKGT
jgi:hypothetical protein